MKILNCTKKYGNRVVFEHISLDLDDSIYHLKGKNGSGKSVFCRCLLGLEEYTSGTISGKEKPVLYLPDTPLGEDWLTMKENIDLLLYYYNIDLPEEEKSQIISRLQITDPNQNYHQVSAGTAIKIGLFLLFINNYWKLIVLDETMSHLDKSIREIIWRTLEKRASEGATVVIVDHNLEIEKEIYLNKEVWKTIELGDIYE